MRSPIKCLKHEGGVALLEFALVFPFLFLLLFGSVEVIRLLYIHQKVEKAGYVIADVVTRFSPAQNPLLAGQVSVDQMNQNVFPLLGRIMGSSLTGGFEDPTKQAVIVTSITNISGTKRIQWQIGSPNAASTENTLSGCDTYVPQTCVRSIVNNKDVAAINGSVVNTPTAFPADVETTLATMPVNENMIVSEVFFYYTPLMQPLLQGVTSVIGASFYLAPRIYVKRTYFTPRTDNLTYLPPTFPAP